MKYRKWLITYQDKGTGKIAESFHMGTLESLEFYMLQLSLLGMVIVSINEEQ